MTKEFGGLRRDRGYKRKREDSESVERDFKRLVKGEPHATANQTLSSSTEWKSSTSLPKHS